jgi:hypothetical protein
MAVCNSLIRTLLVVLSLSTAIWGADIVNPLESVSDRISQVAYSDDDLTADTAPLPPEANYLGNCSQLCYRGPCGGCSNNCCAGYSECCDPQWTVTADALFLRPSATTGQQILFDPLQGTTLFNSSDMAFSCQAGLRLSLMRHGRCGWNFELNFFDNVGPKASAEFPASALPSGIAGVIVDNTILLPVDEIVFEERFRLYSSELNLQRPVNEWLTTLVGFRWVEFYDSYAVQGVESVVSMPFSQAINTHNHLYGFQIGENALLFERTGRLRINGFAKMGVFHNAADQNSNLNDPANFGVLSAIANGSHTAFLCELGLIGSYNISQHVALRGGYQVMWIEGLALASGQIPVTNLVAGTADIATSGGLFYHGATAGIEVTW